MVVSGFAAGFSSTRRTMTRYRSDDPSFDPVVNGSDGCTCADSDGAGGFEEPYENNHVGPAITVPEASVTSPKVPGGTGAAPWKPPFGNCGPPECRHASRTNPEA